MLTYIPKRATNPLEFDIRQLTRAANFLLGKKETDELLASNHKKGFLVMLGRLLEASRAIAAGRENQAPRDIPFNWEEEALAAERKAIAREVLSLRSLHTLPSLETELPYRIRGENQYIATFTNGVNPEGPEGTNGAQLRIGLQDLEATVRNAEQSGAAKVNVTVPTESLGWIRNLLAANNVRVVFQDELAQRPEVKRLWLGDITGRCEALAKKNGTLPKDQATGIAQGMSGQRVTLAENCRITQIEEGPTEGTETRLTLEVTFPEILKALQDAAERKDPEAAGAGTGMLTDRLLRIHAANAYGCNGRDFVRASKQVADSLSSNLVEATKSWLQKENWTKADITRFLEEYAVATLTLPEQLRPKNRLELGYSSIQNTEELSPAPSEAPEKAYTLEVTEGSSGGMKRNCSTAAGPEWADNLAKKEIERLCESPTARQTLAAKEKTFGIEGLAKKQAWVLANYWGVPYEGMQPLDGGAEKVELHSHFLTEEMEEEFNSKKELADQELFDSKNEHAIDEATGLAKERLDKREWLSEQGTLTLTLPAKGPILHRLTRYQQRRSNLGFNTTRAEEKDRDISLPKRALWQTPRKADGNILTLEDCLTEGAWKEVRSDMDNGDEETIALVRRAQSLLAELQSGARRWSPAGRNPAEGRLWTWLAAIARGEGDDLRCQSLEEVGLVFNEITSNTGKIPWETQKTPEHLQMPARSSRLPFLLLCGTGQEEMNDLLDNHAELWDMTMRWQNASSIHETTEEIEATRLERLTKALESENPNAITEHAVEMELSQKPDFLRGYLKRIGLPGGLRDLPRELQAFGDIILPLNQSPATMSLKGEETPVETVLEKLAKEGVKIEIPALPENIGSKALEDWRRNCIAALNTLQKANSPTGLAAETTIIVQAAGEGEEKDAFDESLATLHKTFPQSETEKRSLITLLLSHNPPTVRITTLHETFTARRGSAGQWTADSSTEEATQALEKLQEASDLLQNPNEETEKLVAAAATAATRTRLIHNVEKIADAINQIPNHLASLPKIQDLTQPLRLLAEQIGEAKRAASLSRARFKEWAGTGEAGGDWGWEEERVLNPQGAINVLCDSITGRDKLDEEADRKRPKYFVQRLFGEKERAEAASRLATEGREAAATYLEEVLSQNMNGVEEVAATSLPELIQTLETELSSLLEKSHTKEAVEFFTTNPAIQQLLEDKFKTPLLEKAIRQAATELAKTKGTVIEGDKVTHEQVGRDILPGKGISQKVEAAITPSGTEVTTNKLWAAGWLESPEGNSNIQSRINTASWIKTNKVEPATAIAFLEFCRHRQLGEVPAAIAEGKLDQEETKTLKTSLERFEKALGEIGIPEKGSLRTKLHGALALHQYLSASWARKSLWKEDWEKELEGIHQKGVAPSKTLRTVFTERVENPTVSTESPFRSSFKLASGELLEEDIEKSSEKTKLSTVARAIGVLHKPIPFEKRHRLGIRDEGRTPNRKPTEAAIQ